MDFAKLNPWRITPNIYKWDDNYRPLVLSATGADGSPSTFSTVIPPEYYATLQAATIRLTADFGLGSSNASFQIFRGSDVVFFAAWLAATQLQTTITWIIFNGAGAVDSTSANVLPKHGAPNNLSLLPGDRIEVVITSNKPNPRDPILFLNLNAYYF